MYCIRRILLSKDATISVELLKLIFQSEESQHMALLVKKAVDSGLAQVILNDVLSAEEDSLARVTHQLPSLCAAVRLDDQIYEFLC
jgi:hypothetical protein